MLQMLKRLAENFLYVIIVKGVIDGLPYLASFHHPYIAQKAQLMRDRRLPHFQHLRQIMNTHLALLQCMDDFDPGRIAKRLNQSATSKAAVEEISLPLIFARSSSLPEHVSSQASFNVFFQVLHHRPCIEYAQDYTINHMDNCSSYE